MKIAVLGFSGSGKSTLAKFLSAHYGEPLLYLDTVQFVADWKERDRDQAREMVMAVMQQDGWVIDGNYGGFYQAERLAQADQIILMLFPRFVCLHRALRRYLKFRNQTRESMAEGCCEKMDLEFAWWILHKGRSRAVKSHYRKILQTYGEKTTVLRSQRQLQRFYDGIAAQAGAKK